MTNDHTTQPWTKSAHRYSIYFAPAFNDPWWQAGCEWLGRDAFTGAALQLPSLALVTAEDQRRLTAAPRRYGWHATLKAPFALAEGADVSQLLHRLREVCRELRPFALPSLEVRVLDDFLALTLTKPCADLDHVARECVSQLHLLAAPLSEVDLARRRAAGISANEDAMLVKWGYPYVMDEFRFHMSLTGPSRGVPTEVIDAMREAASTYFSPLPTCKFASVALFAEPTPGADFVLLEHVPLGG